MLATRRSYVVQRPLSVVGRRSSVVTNIVCAFVAVAAVFVLPPVLVVVSLSNAVTVAIAIAIGRWLAVRWHDATMMFLACLPACLPASLLVAPSFGRSVVRSVDSFCVCICCCYCYCCCCAGYFCCVHVKRATAASAPTRVASSWRTHNVLSASWLPPTLLTPPLLPPNHKCSSSVHE